MKKLRVVKNPRKSACIEMNARRPQWIKHPLEDVFRPDKTKAHFVSQEKTYKSHRTLKTP